MSEPEDRRRDDGGADPGPDAVPPWDPSQSASPPPPSPPRPTPTPGPPGDPWGFGGPVAPPRPGIVPLRPLTLGELLEGALRYIREHPRVVLGIAAVVAVVTVLLAAPFQASLGNPPANVVSPDAGRPPDLGQVAGVLRDAAALAGIQVLISLLANTVLTGLLVVVLSRSVLGAPIVARDCWEAARPRLPGLLAVVVLVALATVVAFVVPLVPAGLAALVGAPAGAIAGLAVLGVLAGIVLAVAVAVVLALAAPAYVLEGIGVTTALRRSRSLVTGRFWPVLGILVLTAVIVTVVAGIVGFPFGEAAGAVGRAIGDTGPASPLPLLITSIGTVVGATLTTPFQAGVTGLLYIDQRMRREGFDVELQRAARLR